MLFGQGREPGQEVFAFPRQTVKVCFQRAAAGRGAPCEKDQPDTGEQGECGRNHRQRGLCLPEGVCGKEREGRGDDGSQPRGGSAGGRGRPVLDSLARVADIRFEPVA